MLVRLVLVLVVLRALGVGYVLWRRPPRRLRGSHLDLEGLGIRGPAIVQFTAPYCAPCRAAAPRLAEVAGDARVGFAQVDVGQRPDVARALRIRTVPTIAVADGGGRVLGVWTGLPSTGEIAELASRARA